MSNWFAAHVIMYVKYKHGRQTGYPVWENIILVNADTEDEAFEKAEKLAKRSEGDDGGTFRWGGREATWVFGGVRKLSLCQNAEERPGDGTEISYIQLRVRSEANLRKLIRSERVGVEYREVFAENGESNHDDFPSNSGSVRLLAEEGKAIMKPEIVTVPILVVNKGVDSDLKVRQEYGTAFYLGNDVFMTAAHCLEKPAVEGKLNILLPRVIENGIGSQGVVYEIAETELFPDHDIGLARVSGRFDDSEFDMLRFKWSFDILRNLADVSTQGFPHGLHFVGEEVLVCRSHKGYVVTRTPYRHREGGPEIESYEVSFQVPKGLSGGPLARWDNDALAGVLIGMRATDLMLRTEREVFQDGKGFEITNFTQTVHYGLAIPTYIIGELKSKLLGKTIKEYVTGEGLVTDGQQKGA